MNKIVTPRLITDDERREAEAFQEMLQLFYDSFTDNKGRRGMDSFRSYQNLKKQTKRYHNYPWFASVKGFFERTDSQFKEYFQSKRSLGKIATDELTQIKNKAIDALRNKDARGFIALAPKLKEIGNAAEKTIISPEQNLYNPLYNENPLIFATSRFLTVFERPEMQKILEMDLNVYKYTYLNMAKESANNFEFIAYWMMELRSSDEPFELSSHKFKKYNEIMNDTAEYKNLLKMVDSYLRNNDKSMINNIIKEMQKYPDLIEANNAAKYKYEFVYRGLGFYRDKDEPIISQTEIIENEKRAKYVATSSSIYAARNFEYMRGHMQGDIRNSDYGYMLTYKVNPESIILDTRIFGGIYDENEIIIDVTKSELEDIEFSENNNFD